MSKVNCINFLLTDLPIGAQIGTFSVARFAFSKFDYSNPEPPWAALGLSFIYLETAMLVYSLPNQGVGCV